MAKDTLVPMSIVELEKVANACSMKMNLSLYQDTDEYKNIILNLIADQSFADQMKALFELKIINVNRCIKCNYINCNEELGSSINLPMPLIGKTNIVDLNSVLRLFSRPNYIKVQKCALSAVALAIYISLKSYKKNQKSSS